MRSTLRLLGILFLFILLSVLTQIGGIVLLISILLGKTIRWKNPFKSTFIFVSLYFLSTFVLVPPLAKMSGREPIKHSQKIQPTALYTVILNRNYVRPELHDLLQRAENRLKLSDVGIHYLDASFPFVNGFPLLPHLSHNDGKKIDLSLIYETPEGRITDKQKSNSGYGVFEEPEKGEFDQIEKCKTAGYFQYDYPKYLTLGLINKNLLFSNKGSKLLVEAFLKDQSVGKLFIEPHLKERLHLKNSKIRYHGCQAVRHDDHIHIQL